MPRYFPAMLNIEGLPCLVVGGGEVAERKTLSLLANGAKVRLISPEVTEGLEALIKQGQIEWVPRPFNQGDTAGCFLVISSANEESVNQEVAAECKSANILVNVVDDPPKCSFIVPAVVKRGDLVIAVSTGGASPMLAGKLRSELEYRYGPEYEEYLKLLSEARAKVLQEVPAEHRYKVFERLTEGHLLRLLQEGRSMEAKEWVKQCLS